MCPCATERRDGRAVEGNALNHAREDKVARHAARAPLRDGRRLCRREAHAKDEEPDGGGDHLANLVQNDVFHNHSGGHVAVLLKVLPEQRFHISVFDDGPGLSDGALVGLGDKTFRHDDARTRSEEQPGLGLAITHEIAARAGWTLIFQPNQPKGLHVIIEGPILSEE